jgi:hypothetical protein
MEATLGTAGWSCSRRQMRNSGHVTSYLVKPGKYDVKSSFTPQGQYGGWRWKAIIPYVLVLAAESPFLDQRFYSCPWSRRWAGPTSHGSWDLPWLA